MISKNGALKMLEYINHIGTKYPIDFMIQNGADILNILYTNEDIVSKEKEKDLSKIVNMIDLERIEYEKKLYSKFFYTNIIENLDFEGVSRFALDKNIKGVVFYDGEKIDEIYQNCVHYVYIINNKTLVILANPFYELKDTYYLDPLKKNFMFNIDDIINY
jgi:hypothetical protein